MQRVLYRVTADAIFLLHVSQIVLTILGWLLPVPYYYFYVAVLAIAFTWQFLFHDCFLTGWEFYFRRKLDPSIGPSPYYLTYYSHKYFTDWVTNAFVDRVSLIFLSVSLLVAALRLSGFW